MASNDKGAATWGAAAKSTKAAKDETTPDEGKVITVGSGDFEVTNDDDGDTITLVIAETTYALDLEAAGNLAEDLVDANPELEKTTGEED